MALVACLLPLLAGVWVLAASGAVDVTRPASWLALGAAAGGWAGALWLARGLANSGELLLVIACGALALRLPFLAAEPELSDDVHRYVWEGALLAEGLDPYRVPPSAPELAPYRQRWAATFERVNHPDVPAVYPPLALAVHAGLVQLAGGGAAPARARFTLRAFYSLCDLLVCWPLAHLLAQRRLPRALLVAWAWNPWVALEFAGSGHLDALAILCATTALVCFPPHVRVRTPRACLGLALLAAGAAVKLLPGLLVPFVLRRARRPGLVGLVFLASSLAFLAPSLLATGRLPGTAGLGEYAFRWESFSLLFRWIEPFFAAFFAFDESWSDPRRLARALALVLLLGLALHAWRARFEPVRAAAWVIGALLVLTPTLHPWYLAWIVPFLALGRSLAWCTLVAVSPLLYWPVTRWRDEGVWAEPSWLGPTLAGTFWALAGLELLLAGRARRVQPR